MKLNMLKVLLFTNIMNLNAHVNIEAVIFLAATVLIVIDCNSNNKRIHLKTSFSTTKKTNRRTSGGQ
jgi:hypothetical protein